MIHRNTNDHTISFIFPVTVGIMGGVQKLIINIIAHVATEKLCNVRLYDYDNGLIRQELERLDVKGYDFIALDGCAWQIPNIGDEVFVVTGFGWTTYPFYFKTLVNVRFLMWDVYYPVWKSFYKIKTLELLFIRNESMRILCAKGGIVFMEQKGLDLFKSISPCSNLTESNIIAVPIALKDNIYFKLLSDKVITNRPLTFGYIGRAEWWKVTPVIKIIRDLSGMKCDYRFIIFTNDSSVFKRALPDCENIDIEYRINYTGEVLEKTILENVDVGYSMGTAALEFAKLGVPTILADFTDGEFPVAYKYRLLYDADYGSLGVHVSEVDCSRRRDLSDILNNIDLPYLSTRCFQYCARNHEISKVVDKLILKTKETELNARDTTLALLVYFEIKRRLDWFKRFNNNPSEFKHVWSAKV